MKDSSSNRGDPAVFEQVMQSRTASTAQRRSPEQTALLFEHQHRVKTFSRIIISTLKDNFHHVCVFFIVLTIAFGYNFYLILASQSFQYLFATGFALLCSFFLAMACSFALIESLGRKRRK